jgi:hypothetical protein
MGKSLKRAVRDDTHRLVDGGRTRCEAWFASVAAALVMPSDGDADDPDVSCVALTPIYKTVEF